jgi:hypothetical protein
MKNKIGGRASDFCSTLECVADGLWHHLATGVGPKRVTYGEFEALEEVP